MLQVASDLEAMGHDVASRWVRRSLDLQDAEATVEERRAWADDDIMDIMTSNCAIAFTEDPVSPYARGGRHVEAGIALARRTMDDFKQLDLPMRLICVGPRENVFYCLPDWEHFRDWPACRAALEAEAGVTA
jgi:hypothetical protein